MAGKPKPKSALERARAAQRIAQDGERPRGVSELAPAGGATKETLVRWIIEGKSTGTGRVYMDGFHDAARGWVSTTAAVQRFLAAVQQHQRA